MTSISDYHSGEEQAVSWDAIWGAIVGPWGLLGDLWREVRTADAPVKGAIIGGTFTVLTALVGVLVLSWQLRRQGENTIAGNQHNEAMKLKKDVYEGLVAVCLDARKAQAEFRSYVTRFLFDLDICHGRKDLHLDYYPPKARAAELNELYYARSGKITMLIGFTEKWEIIDPRVDVFRLAFAHANHELDGAWGSYFEMALFVMPKDSPGRIEFNLPDQNGMTTIRARSTEVQDCLSLIDCYIGDLQTQMQTALLGDMFKNNRVKPRSPKDPKWRAVRFDQYDELVNFFENETPMGMHHKEVARQARERFSS